MKIENWNWKLRKQSTQQKWNWNWNWNWNLNEIEINLKLKIFTCSVVDFDFDLRFEKEKKNRPRRRGRRLDFDVWWGRWQEISTSTRVTRRLNFDRIGSRKEKALILYFNREEKRLEDESHETMAQELWLQISVLWARPGFNEWGFKA